ncbi:pyrophosphatase PpaX [Oceanobacillus neutriphilus]|uniref:Pyrophosphatase PpaX n=1 Tax=Oceanobacillus neutriphilus TaxID=531815 RepID=A0ABQ2NNL2_9BACI|nr:pyrophosphatase PpaX [Oceanobacillus neutriphilus]GGP06893.1 pyrophosphatase PpaX [Oceanobacillus neutriphilus]
MSIRTILFDLDGTLLNTNELIRASFEHTFEKFNMQFTPEEIKHLNGPPLNETFHEINPELSERMTAAYREYNMREHDRYVEAFPYVYETIKQLYDKGITLGIVSTKIKKTVMMGLDLTSLTDFFSVIITYDDVTLKKPDPEPVEKAMKLVHANPETTLMVGDNFHDIVSGQRAGTQTAAVSWSEKTEAFLKSYQPTYYLDTMKDLLTVAGE